VFTFTSLHEHSSAAFANTLHRHFRLLMTMISAYDLTRCSLAHNYLYLK